MNYWWVLGVLFGVALVTGAFVLSFGERGSAGGASVKVPLAGEFSAAGMASLALILGVLLGGYSLFRLAEPAGETKEVVTRADDKSAVVTGSSVLGAAPPSLDSASLNAALLRGISKVHASGSAVQAAVWVEGADMPVIAGDALDQPMRPWSMVRVATTIAAYRAAVASGQPGPSPTMTEAMRGTIVRAENCRHHRLVLGLQELAGGREAARAAVAKVFSDAGAEGFEVADQQGRAEPYCDAYLTQAGDGLKDPTGTVVQFGTSSWTISDAIDFAHSLGAGVFGDAGRFVLDLMREPKQTNRDSEVASDYAAPLDWGAGRVLERWDPAYKGGWGGAHRPVKYVAGQIAVVTVADRNVAIAAVIHPATEPTSDDPRRAGVIEPIEAIFNEIAEQFTAAG